MSLLRLAYHEAAHGLVARDLQRPVELISLLEPDYGGATKTGAPIAGDRTPEALEQGLLIVLAGEIGESYAPIGPHVPDAEAHAETNGGARGAPASSAPARTGPSDEEIVEHYRAELGDGVVERARMLAAHLVDRKHATGRLELVADRLLLSGVLTGEELERLLSAPAA